MFLHSRSRSPRRRDRSRDRSSRRSRSGRSRKRRRRRRSRNRSSSEVRNRSDESRSPENIEAPTDRHGNKRSRKGRKIFNSPSPDNKGISKKSKAFQEMSFFDPDAGFPMPKDDKEEIKRMFTKPAPQIRPADPTSTNRCFRCLLKGHRADACPNEARCRGCRRVGHMEAECPEKPENKAIIEAEKKRAAKDQRRADRRAKAAEMNDSIRRRQRTSRVFDQFYFRSLSPECEAQRQAIIDDDTNNLKDECGSRTIFCMQLNPKIKANDLFDFFTAVGKVNEVKIIYDKFTKKSRGIAYIEFRTTDSVPIALSLNGQKLLNHPIIVQPSQAEKNKYVTAATYAKMTVQGPPLLDIANLHHDITNDLLIQVFQPFGSITRCEINREIHTGRSKGHGQILFVEHDAATKAKEALNGFELAGKPMKVTSPEDDKKNITIDEARAVRRSMNINDPTFDGIVRNFDIARSMPVNQGGGSGGGAGLPDNLDSDKYDKGGVAMDATGRVKLMAKLAQGTGMDLPQQAKDALVADQNRRVQEELQAQIYGAATTPCFQLANLFNPKEETNPNWYNEIRDDVLFQCQQFGGICHVKVDTTSPEGVVFLRG